MKAKRNKTIDFQIEDSPEYLSRCVKAKDLKKGQNCVTVLGDFFEAIENILDKSIDLLIVDPPYNLTKDFHGNEFKETNTEEYISYLESWIEKVKPKLKETASVYVCCDWKTAIPLGVVLEKHFTIRNRITWEREKGRGAKDNWKNSMEDIFYCTVGKNFTFNLEQVKQRKKVIAPYKENGKPKDWEQTEDGKFRYTCPSNFWGDISVPYWSMAENTAHPTQKPEKLIAKLILASSNPNDLVLDIFAGSGTTGVVAKKLSRRYINIEQNPLYCAWGEYRLEKCEEDNSIQGYKDGVFWERNSL
ncbi:MAG: site-specific DNA-methyltransferase [Clostridia bacterium]|nr:site-specific DNA-methyltransferase [Clostridia bacterium]